MCLFDCVLFQSAVTPHVYKERLDFPCKERTWIHVQNPNLGPIRTGDPNFPKLFVLKTICTLRVIFQAVTKLRSKYRRRQSCSSRKNEELFFYTFFHFTSSRPFKFGHKQFDAFSAFPNPTRPRTEHVYGRATCLLARPRTEHVYTILAPQVAYDLGLR